MESQSNSNASGPAPSMGNNIPAISQSELSDISSFAARIPVPQLQGYAITNIKSWFTRLEAFFQINGFGRMNQDQRDLAKFNITVMYMDEKLHEQVYEIVRNPPQENRYKLLKELIISKFTTSPMARLEQLVTGIQLGDSKPSHILSQLYRTDVTNDTHLIKNLWLQRLPVSVRAIVTCVDKSNLTCSMDELGAIADEILDSVRINSIESISATTNNNVSIDAVSENISGRLSQIEQKLTSLQNEVRRSRSLTPPRIRSRSTSSQICWYHKKFGAQSRKCNKTKLLKNKEVSKTNLSSTDAATFGTNRLFIYDKKTNLKTVGTCFLNTLLNTVFI